ncbi:hypothetical protein Pint_17381 [Pistacia integerrima]|uniref:Uncharacterized protein n=1 Tax=Pistacia integerrima TaxID=434235 RepID=A0ACC0YV77_9ROSI|nr:hypothetical protein Pint_17381 [Pistacia integerrima]
MMRPIFCGNFEYDARQSDLERLFRRYGKVDRVDMKSVKSSIDKALQSVQFTVHEDGSSSCYVIVSNTSEYVTQKQHPSLVEFQWGIFLGYPYSRLMDALFRIPFPACDELPLLVLRKSHSHLQWHNHTTFFSLPFHSS